MNTLGQIGENHLFHTACGTSLGASAASLTLIIINFRQIIRDGDGFMLTDFFALAASDAGVLAGLTGVGALFGVTADHHSFGFLGDQRDNVLGADRLAKTAAQAEGGIHVSDTILQADGVGGTSGGAIAQTETAETASVGASVEHGGGFTGGYAVIGGFLGGGFADK